MNQFNNIAVIGSGQLSSLFNAALFAKLPSGCNLTVHVHSKEAARRAYRRIEEVLVQLERFDDCPGNLKFDFSGSVDEKVDLVFEQLPSEDNRAKLRSAYCKNLAEDVPVLSYSSTFPEITDDVSGYFHYSNPAHLLPLLELGLPNQGTVVPFLKSLGFLTLSSEDWLPGFFSNRIQAALLESACSFYEKPEDAELFDRTLAYYAKKVFSDYTGIQGTNFKEVVSEVNVPRSAKTETVEEVVSQFLECLVELEQFWKPEEIARALRYGPGIRFISPGFLRFVDMEGIAEFYKVVDAVNPDADMSTLISLIEVGRIGSRGRSYVNNGFHDWNLDQWNSLKINSNQFLRRRLQNTP